MASPVICNKHGRQNGALACRHVEEAVWTKTRGPVEFRKVTQNYMGDDTKLLASLLCSECIHAFGIDPEKILPLLDKDDEHFRSFPDIAPICAQCLAEYQKVHAT
jgi:hypothetical protein